VFASSIADPVVYPIQIAIDARIAVPAIINVITVGESRTVAASKIAVSIANKL